MDRFLFSIAGILELFHIRHEFVARFMHVMLTLFTTAAGVSSLVAFRSP